MKKDPTTEELLKEYHAEFNDFLEIKLGKPYFVNPNEYITTSNQILLSIIAGVASGSLEIMKELEDRIEMLEKENKELDQRLTENFRVLTERIDLWSRR